MISLTMLVWTVVWLLVAAAVIGLLWWLIGFVQQNIGGPEKVYAVIRVIFICLIVIGLCLFLIAFTTGQPMFRP